jgi:hypothetical protein
MNAVSNAFVAGLQSVPAGARTANGMKAQTSTLSPVVDLFYKIGASRGLNLSADFERAYQEDSDLALRMLLWARDVRGGAGERQIVLDLLQHLEQMHPDVLLNTRILELMSEVGRWKDLFCFKTPAVKARAFALLHKALLDGNGLAAKWTPRKGPVAMELCRAWGLTPKQLRQWVVRLTSVVETPMCAKDYSKVNYSHVPSLAMARYQKAFRRNDTERFTAFKEALKAGTTKINASAVFPYDVLKSLVQGADAAVCDAQWAALPDYMDGTPILPLVDVSGSMEDKRASGSLTCLDVALSLGLYCADRNKGPFKDVFATFSHNTEIVRLRGTLSEKMAQMKSADWQMDTNLHSAFERILEVALGSHCPPEDMPKAVLILSDMQFNRCVKHDDSAIEMIDRQYREAGYERPVVVFWNLNAEFGNAPVSFTHPRVATVSGFSPATLRGLLGTDFDTLTPLSVVKQTLCVERYDYT